MRIGRLGDRLKPYENLGDLPKFRATWHLCIFLFFGLVNVNIDMDPPLYL